MNAVVDQVIILDCESLGICVINESLDSIRVLRVKNVVEERFVYCTVLRQFPREELGHSWKFECLFILVANSKLIIVRHLYEPDVLNLLKGTSSTHHFLQKILSYLVIWR